MGGPSVEQQNTFPEELQGGQQATSNFLLSLFGIQPPQQAAAQANPFADVGAGGLLGGGGAINPEAIFSNMQQQQAGAAGQAAQPFGGRNALTSFLGQGPLQELSQGAGMDAAQQVIGAAQPVFDRNLQQALAMNAAQASSPFNTAFGLQNQDTSTQALQDFNLFQQQALQQGQQTAMQAAEILQSGRLGALGQLLRFFAPMPADNVVRPGFTDRLFQAASIGSQFVNPLQLGGGGENS